MLGPVIVIVFVVRPPVRLSFCHTRISSKLSEIDIWLLENSNRNPGFPIQKLPSDLRSEIQFRHFGCFRVAVSDKLYRKDTGTTLGSVTGQLSSRPTTNHTCSVSSLKGFVWSEGLHRLQGEICCSLIITDSPPPVRPPLVLKPAVTNFLFYVLKISFNRSATTAIKRGGAKNRK